MYKVLIADDHQIVIDGIEAILLDHPNYKVVARARDGEEVLNHIKENAIDIAILDVEMPKPDGVQLAIQIGREYPGIKVLILTMHNEEAFISKIVEANAAGYILKHKGQEELIEALNDITVGKTFYGKEVTQTIVESWKAGKARGSDSSMKLTKREEEVLRLVAEGKSTPEISKILFIAPPTVETHKKNIRKKTNCNSLKALMRWAWENGYS